MQADVLVWIFALTAACALLLVLTRRAHGRWTSDFANSGVQKHHVGDPPRVGLLPLLAGSLLAYFMLSRADEQGLLDAGQVLGLLLLCGVPAYGVGLLEDLTKAVRARWRLLGAGVGAGLGIALLGAAVPSVGIPWLDDWVSWAPFSFLLTLLLVAGFTNAMNIVDGLNGLAGGLMLLMLAVTAWAASGADDALIVQLCVCLGVVLLGFFVVNFPRGLIFLGDGGAYFLGFMMVEIWVLLVVRNPGEISPWFVVAVAFHPTMETIFSILRRKLRRTQRPATAPDRLHIHALLYRRRAVVAVRDLPWVDRWAPNAFAAMVVVAMAALPMVLALWRPASSLWNLAVVVLSAALFLGLFKHLLIRLLPTADRVPGGSGADLAAGKPQLSGAGSGGTAGPAE